jgi:hypothetical protein
MPPAPPVVKKSVLPLLALLSGLLGGCVPPLFFAAPVLIGLSLIRRREPAFAAGRAQTVAGLVAWLLTATVVGGLLFSRSNDRLTLKSRQAACKTALKSAYTAERAWFDAHQQYTSSPKALGLDRPTRELLRLDGTSALQLVGLAPEQWVGREGQRAWTIEQLDEATPQAVKQALGVRGTCPDCAITLSCVTDLDDDDTVDVWTISTAVRTGREGPIGPGEPYNDVDDVEQ